MEFLFFEEMEARHGKRVYEYIGETKVQKISDLNAGDGKFFYRVYREHDSKP
jgi:hypothetical protein